MTDGSADLERPRARCLLPAAEDALLRRHSFLTVRGADPADHTWRVTDRNLMLDGTLAFHGPPADHVLL